MFVDSESVYLSCLITRLGEGAVGIGGRAGQDNRSAMIFPTDAYRRAISEK